MEEAEDLEECPRDHRDALREVIDDIDVDGACCPSAIARRSSDCNVFLRKQCR